MSIVTEKSVLRDFLEAYKSLPCLWDQSHDSYMNRAARNEAYESLVHLLRPIQSDATADTVKKKIENMRTAYRREQKKLLASRAAGKQHIPRLWYFKHLSFLKKDWPSFVEDTCTVKSSSSSGDEEDYEIQVTPTSLIYDDEPPSKIVKFEDLQNDPVTEQVTYDSCITTEDLNCEAEAFGKTVGLQLKQLSHMQKILAEKLISEVIFYGRLDKLNLNSTLNVNEDIS